jgi:hypothetical protein
MMYVVAVLVLRRRGWCTTMVRSTKGSDLFSLMENHVIQLLFKRLNIIVVLSIFAIFLITKYDRLTAQYIVTYRHSYVPCFTANETTFASAS